MVSSCKSDAGQPAPLLSRVLQLLQSTARATRLRKLKRAVFVRWVLGFTLSAISTRLPHAFRVVKLRWEEGVSNGRHIQRKASGLHQYSVRWQRRERVK